MPALRHLPPFKLTQFFSTTSLIGIVIVTTCLIWTYRELTVRHLVAHEGRANADLTRAFANSIWRRYRDFVLRPAGRSRENLIADPRVPKLRADVIAKMKGLQVVKIKIYNLDGLTVFSTDESQIGEDKSTNQGFQDALVGKISNHISYREKFDAFEGVLNKRNLIASYIPIQPASDAPVEGVFEVYSDVTELLQQQSRAQWQVAGIVLTLLGTLYLFLFFVVRKADRIIARQEAERAEQEENVRHQAYHDALTGLPNRAYFSERLDESITLASRHENACALMFIDLDRFKIVNDSLGHHSGDLLLQEVSGRIESCLHPGDLLFRIGGDEFTIILPHVEAPEDAAFMARRILEKVAVPIRIHDHEVVPGATIGIAVFPGDGDKAEVLLKNADAAMYSAKQLSRGTHAFYRADMNLRAHQRLDLETALRKGFCDGEFAIYYQPRLDAMTREVVALEALLRWDSPSRGLVLPQEFIGVLEDTGMINIVGEWALRSVCTQVADWQLEGRPPLRVSANVSSIQFQNPMFVEMVERVIRESGAPASLIELELTESNLISNKNQARKKIDSLKRLGISITIDDFGTGYSPLNYLRQFEVDYLKIDRSFVTEIATDPRTRAVAVAIIDLAKALDIAVVAEGIETTAQAKFFTQAQCSELQGFLFSEPLPIDKLQQLLRSGAQTAPDQGFSPLFSNSPARHLSLSKAT